MELYIHLPFCRSKCRYCDFASWSGKESLMPRYVEALLQEAATMAATLPALPIETIFLGGGTPSTLPPELLDSLLVGLRQFFPFDAVKEFTTEANPGTLTHDWLMVARKHGVNRLSLGMQAAQPALLKQLGRIHTTAQVAEAVALSRDAGITNISLDLMFGLPGQTMRDWQESLDTALSLQPNHLSCYGLIPEEGTPLFADLEAGRLSLPDEEEERAMYDNTLRRLSSAGFVQYEISNFARPGYACQHNLGYWRQVHYIGFGASASSMLPTNDPSFAYIRQTNPPNIADYLQMVHAGDWHRRETESITPKEARFETMMLGLRTTQGVSETTFAQMHGQSLSACYGEKLEAQQHLGLVEHVNGLWRLTRKGMDVQNSVLVALMDD